MYNLIIVLIAKCKCSIYAEGSLGLISNFHHIGEFGLQRCTADEETVN
jgi:hypothetical protein